jgi:tryptophan halogenase
VYTRIKGEFMKINKIVIVGGGSSGWMSAATMINKFPDKEIVLIESPDFPIIGVGESTLGSITGWMNWLGIDEKDFMSYTDATYKMSIAFTDFYNTNNETFHYPFGYQYSTKSVFGENDWFVRKAFDPSLPVSDYAESLYPALTLAKQNKINKNESMELENFVFKRDVAYHFDAIKFGQWLKNNYCLPKGVKLISDTVIDINVNDNGIESLILSNGNIIESDLFIDCTGFKSLLLGETLKEKFIDYSEQLPNNRAWVARVPYTDKEKEMRPYTQCTAIENGWVWTIPVWERLGTGYVYSDKYISKEQALEDFKKFLRSDKMPVHVPDRDLDSLTFRDVSFKTGIYERIWVKNVVAIGLSAGFVEPLESNGLFSVHEFLFRLSLAIENNFMSQQIRDSYNFNIRKLFSALAEFISLHFSLSSRTDTEYWKDVNNKKYPNIDFDGYLRDNEYVALSNSFFDTRRYKYNSGISCIGTGMHRFPLKIDEIILDQFLTQADYYEMCKPVFDHWDKRKKEWQLIADNSPTMYQWLKENIHNK